IGAAMQGMRPVVEIMYEDFLTLSLEQIVNQAAKHRYMSGGQLKVPLTIRTQGGAGWSPGAQHAQQLEAWVVHVPGLKVVFAFAPAMEQFVIPQSDDVLAAVRRTVAREQ